MKRLISACFAVLVAGAAYWTILASHNSLLIDSPRSQAPVVAAAVNTSASASNELPPVKSPLDIPPTVVPPTLFSVTISPEARVKATAVESRRDLLAKDWTTFQITIENAAGITAPLVIESEQLMRSPSDTDRDHWLQLALEPNGPLTGQPQEIRTLRLYSRDSGIRTALLNINAGQGTQDLGFRSDVLMSFFITEGHQFPK